MVVLAVSKSGAKCQQRRTYYFLDKTKKSSKVIFTHLSIISLQRDCFKDVFTNLIEKLVDHLEFGQRVKLTPWKQ